MENILIAYIWLSSIVIITVFILATVKHCKEVKRIKEQFKNRENETNCLSCYSSTGSFSTRILD
jgi:hypothetical protein